MPKSENDLSVSFDIEIRATGASSPQVKVEKVELEDSNRLDFDNVVHPKGIGNPEIELERIGVERDQNVFRFRILVLLLLVGSVFGLIVIDLATGKEFFDRAAALIVPVISLALGHSLRSRE